MNSKKNTIGYSIIHRTVTFQVLIVCSSHLTQYVYNIKSQNKLTYGHYMYINV